MAAVSHAASGCIYIAVGRLAQIVDGLEAVEKFSMIADRS
jgi:hypothetical protein